MKITVLDGYGLNPGDLSWEPIAQLGELTVFPRTSAEEFYAHAEGADILLTNKTLITAEHIDRLPDLKYIGILATGYNVVDYNYAREKGIPVVNVPTYGTASVSQFSSPSCWPLPTAWNIMPKKTVRDVGAAIRTFAIGTRPSWNCPVRKWVSWDSDIPAWLPHA